MTSQTLRSSSLEPGFVAERKVLQELVENVFVSFSK